LCSSNLRARTSLSIIISFPKVYDDDTPLSDLKKATKRGRFVAKPWNLCMSS
jgi:hypothetical protein